MKQTRTTIHAEAYYDISRGLQKKIVLCIIAILCLWASVSLGTVIRWDGNGHCYEAVNIEEGITWTASNAAAEAKGYDWHLVTISTAEENTFVYSMVDDPSFWRFVGSNGLGPWIGGFKGSGAWEWVTGEPFVYDNWGPLEPFGNGDRIGMFGYYTLMGSYWNDAPDYYEPYGYIIESETVPEPATVFMLGLGSLSLLRKSRKRK